MPRLPVVGQPETSVDPIPRPYRRAAPSAAVFGVHEADQIGEGANLAAKLYREESDRQDDAIFFRFASEATNKVKNALTDPQVGAVNVRGTEAAGITPRVLEELDGQFRDIEERIPNERVKQAFRKFGTEKLAGAKDWLSSHELQEVRRGADAEFDIFTATEADAAAKVRTPAAIAEAHANINTAVDLVPGLSEKERDGLRLKKLGALHIGVLNGMLAQEGGSGAQPALDYAEANKAELPAEVIDTVKQKAKPMVDELWVRSNADKLWIESGADYGQAIARVRTDTEYKDSLQRNELEQRLGLMAQQDDAVKADRHEAAFNRVYDAWDRRGVLSDAAAGDLALMSGRDRGYFEDQTAQRIARAKTFAGEADDVSEADTYYALVQLADQQPAKFGALTLSQFFPHLSKTDRRSITDVQIEIRKRARGEDNKANELLQPLALVTNTAEAAGIIPRTPEAKWTEDQKAAFGWLQNQVQSEMRAYTATKGVNPPLEEVERMVAKYGTQVQLRLVWRKDPTTTLAHAAALQLPNAYVPLAKIPADVEMYLRGYIKSEGNRPFAEPTDEMVEDLYGKIITGQDPKAAAALELARTVIPAGKMAEAERAKAIEAFKQLGLTPTPKAVDLLIRAYNRGDQAEVQRLLGLTGD